MTSQDGPYQKIRIYIILLARNIPHEIVSSLKYYIHKFTNNTESLLHFVRHGAMLKARPNEQLSFDSKASMT